MRQLSRQKQTNNWPNSLFETEYDKFENKTGPSQIQTRTFASQTYSLPPH